MTSTTSPSPRPPSNTPPNERVKQPSASSGLQGLVDGLEQKLDEIAGRLTSAPSLMEVVGEQQRVASSLTETLDEHIVYHGLRRSSDIQLADRDVRINELAPHRMHLNISTLSSPSATTSSSTSLVAQRVDSVDKRSSRRTCNTWTLRPLVTPTHGRFACTQRPALRGHRARSTNATSSEASDRGNIWGCGGCGAEQVCRLNPPDSSMSVSVQTCFPLAPPTRLGPS